MTKTNELLVIQSEIIKRTGSAEIFNKYIQLVRKWLGHRINLAQFDAEARQLIPTELHEKFYLALLSALETRTSSRERSNLQQCSTKNPIGCLPNQKIINGWFLLTACQNGLEEVQPDGAKLIFEHVKTKMADIFEAVLRMSRPFVVTEAGFSHSFGIQRTTNKNNSVQIHNATRLIPARQSISVEDLIDCLNLEQDLIPHKGILFMLLERLKNALPAQMIHPPLPNAQFKSPRGQHLRRQHQIERGKDEKEGEK